jgi:hypothetical protein
MLFWSDQIKGTKGQIELNILAYILLLSHLKLLLLLFMVKNSNKQYSLYISEIFRNNMKFFIKLSKLSTERAKNELAINTYQHDICELFNLIAFKDLDISMFMTFIKDLGYFVLDNKLNFCNTKIFNYYLIKFDKAVINFLIDVTDIGRSKYGTLEEKAFICKDDKIIMNVELKPDPDFINILTNLINNKFIDEYDIRDSYSVAEKTESLSIKLEKFLRAEYGILHLLSPSLDIIFKDKWPFQIKKEFAMLFRLIFDFKIHQKGSQEKSFLMIL